VGAPGVPWTQARHQLLKRVTLPFLQQTLDAFNQGQIDIDTTTQLLNVSRAHRFPLRAAWLQHPTTFTLHLSGGNHRTSWPDDVRQFLKDFLPLQRPPNYPLVADELAARFAFQRDRKSVVAYARAHFPLLVIAPAPIPKPRRRSQRAQVGELWQHDSSLHQGWPAADQQTLLLTLDEHSRKRLGVASSPPTPPGTTSYTCAPSPRWASPIWSRPTRKPKGKSNAASAPSKTACAHC